MNLLQQRFIYLLLIKILMEQKNKAETREKLKTVERELLDRHPNWTQDRAQFVAKRLLCLIP